MNPQCKSTFPIFWAHFVAEINLLFVENSSLMLWLWKFKLFSCLTGAVSTAPLRNIFCEPRSTVVHTGAHLYPYFVALHRCSGSVAHRSPRLVACLPAVEQDVKVMTHDRVRHVRGSVLMKNHTQCKQECVAKEADCHKPSIFSDCRCQCPHKERPKNVNCGPIKRYVFCVTQLLFKHIHNLQH